MDQADCRVIYSTDEEEEDEFWLLLLFNSTVKMWLSKIGFKENNSFIINNAALEPQ